MNEKAEKRTEPRLPKLRNFRVEVKLIGEPIYQFKMTDVSAKGAGLVVNNTSHFLKLIEVGQIMEVNFISPRGFEPKGGYRVQVRHISDSDHGSYKGVRLVGVRIIERL